ncbi:hypothetical protein, partial [Streptomyces sp. NPDC001719]
DLGKETPAEGKADKGEKADEAGTAEAGDAERRRPPPRRRRATGPQPGAWGTRPPPTRRSRTSDAAGRGE